jgi:hypothetical protein
MLLRRTPYVVSVIALSSLFLSVIALETQSPGTQQSKQPANANAPAASDPRGTDQSPLVVRVQPTQKTQEEAAQEQTQRDDQSASNWSMANANRLLAAIGALQLLVFGAQAMMLKWTINKMDEIAEKQGKDMVTSIAESVRSADASVRSASEMERVAKTLIESTEGLKTSIGISREIADRQKLVT